MKVIHRLVLRYTVTLVLFSLAVFFFLALLNYRLGVLFMGAAPLAIWLLDPVRQVKKVMWQHSRAIRLCGLFFVAAILSLAFVILIQNYAESKLPLWLIRIWIYGFICPVGVAMAGLTVSAEIKAAKELDSYKTEGQEKP